MEFKALLGIALVLAHACCGSRKERIRADFYNLKSVSRHEKVPENVKIQVFNELQTQNSGAYAYAKRSGSATKTHRCDIVDQQIPRHLTFITRYRFYSKYTHAYGIPVVASSVVSDEAVKRACYVVRFLFADRSDIRENMYKYYGRVAVIGKNQELTRIPEFSHLPAWWNQRARGLGGTLHIPVSCGGEENLLCLRQDRYYGDDIFFHEAAHAVAELAIRGGPNGDLDGLYAKLLRSYNNARRKGLWRRTYSMDTVREYFAEGAQSFFNCHVSVDPPNGIHNSISTRSKLKNYDPELYRVLEEVFPCKNTYHWCYKGTPPDPAMDCPVGGTRPSPKPRSTNTPVTQKPTEQPPVPTGCEDKEGNCRYWANSGYCTGKWKSYMSTNCRKSCNLCGSGDKNRNCGAWAGAGYCRSSAYIDYMKKNCCKSCRHC
ncbi:uncharacterized protein LOC135689516 [Rhopilema esculentum]|uniref:uncharacterized protein LOC135689516 n=1 Tax=Rhopilema esculentum TaxID=499914 RepID=UPI0031D632DE